MGVPKDQAARNRQAIIDTASRIFRERGVDGVGVADLMKEAGFSHGGFYNHFESKDALAAAACAAAFACAATELEHMAGADATNRASTLRDFMAGYLSPGQCQGSGVGCPSATLAIDAARHGKDMQAAYAQGIETFIRVLTRHFAAEIEQAGVADSDREHAIGMLATLVGTMLLARGVGAADPALSAEILAAGRSRLLM